MEIGDLQRVVEEAMAVNKSYADQYDVSIRLEATDASFLAAYDFDRLLQVMTNLMSNACKFSRPGGEVTVALRTEASFNVIEISDRGVGIPASALDTIFDRFKQASSASRRAQGGTGLGLSIVKAIIEKHGGTVELDSTEGVGTTVRVRIRCARIATPGLRLTVLNQ